MALAIRRSIRRAPGASAAPRATPPRPGSRPRAGGRRSWPPPPRRRRTRAWPARSVTFIRTMMPSTVTCSSSRASGPALDGGGADAHGPGHPLDLGAQRTDVRRVGQHVQHVPGPPLLHGDRAHPGVEGTGLEGGGDGVPELLAGHVVEVRLQHEGGLPGSDGRLRVAAPDHDLGAVGQVGQLARPARRNPTPSRSCRAGARTTCSSAASRAAPVGVVSSRRTSRP